MNMQELLQKRAEIHDKQKAIVGKVRSEGRFEMTQEEDAQFKVFQKEIENVTSLIDSICKVDDMDAELNKQVPGKKIPGEDPKNKERLFKSIGEQMQAVYRASGPQPAVDPRLIFRNAAASGMSENIDTDGGFLVQKDFASILADKSEETGKLQKLCYRLPLSTDANGMKVNGPDETTRADGSVFGGIVAYWENEADTHTGSKPKFRQISLDLRKLTGLCYATDELLKDASALGAYITQGFAKAFGFKIDDALINGLGTGSPKGILKSEARVTIPKEAGQPLKTIITENIINMYSRCNALNPVWYVNRNTLPQLFTMTLNVGAGGVALFMPAGGLSGKPYNTLLGLPIVPLEQCETLGTEGDVILADFADYLVINRDGIESAVSIHVRFLYDEQVFRFIYRIDGQPFRSKPLTPYKGTETLSSFVTIATRS